MIPILGHRDSSQPVAVHAGRWMSAAQFISDVHANAERLPACSHAINLCGDRYNFAVAFAAAMLRGQTNLLPPSQSPAVLRQLFTDYESVHLMVDDDEDRPFDAVQIHAGTHCRAFDPQALAFDADAAAAIAFTSGSTGTPVANRKAWGTMAAGGVSEASRFGLDDGSRRTVFGTVPAQHMYGLETTVVMPLRGGMIMHNDRLFFPADIQTALESCDGHRVLVSTPVHLRALLASEVTLPALELAICATAPLSLEMAEQFERRFETRVHEVYGFTEAGMVATRRTADGPAWRLLAGLSIRREADQNLVSGGHVPAEVAFSDLIDVEDAEHFVLRGRHSDLVNVAGKRTSIAYLDHQLCAIEGVQDAAFLMPDDDGDSVTRLTACAVAPGLSREQLLGALGERIDPVFLPRPLYLVDALPRNSTGKLPRNELLDLVRECASTSRNRDVSVERTIEADHPALAGHFPGDPVVPGVVLLDEIVDVVSMELGSDAALPPLNIRSAKFMRPVRPGERLQIELSPGATGSVRFVCRVGSETAVSGTLTTGHTGDA